MKRKKSGQEAVEFILITILVFFGALFVLLVFGNKIAGFFTSESSVSKNSDLPIPAMSSLNQVKYGSNYTTGQSAVVDPKYNATTNADGSVSMSVNGQNVTIPKEVFDMHNVVLQTSGASGANELISDIARLIEQNAAQYPPGEVPVNIVFGTGSREKATANYTGSAQANLTSVQVGNSVVIYQMDQTCGGSSCKSSNMGKYKIEGTLDTNNNLTGTVNFTKDPASSAYSGSGNYSGQVSTTSNGGFTINGKYGTGNGSWEFIFDGSKTTL